jgi:branched-chain amino acid aminotransferase
MRVYQYCTPEPSPTGRMAAGRLLRRGGAFLSRRRASSAAISSSSPSPSPSPSPFMAFQKLEAPRVESPNSLSDVCPSLRVLRTSSSSAKPPKESLIFGKTFTSHMLTVEWSKEKGWSAPEIKPFQDLSLSPAASVLHYGLECFEGMKAYRDAKGSVRLFRPACNIARLNHSLARMCLPQVDADGFLTLLRELVLLDKDWIPDGNGYSMYIRPTCIATNRYLGVGPPDSALFYVILCPVGPYYASGFKPITLWADRRHVRAWPGGTGDAKVGANYAISIAPQVAAAKHGCSQVLWLRGEESYLTEVGAMNLFLSISGGSGYTELVTPPLSQGDILPGVTRASILELASSMGDVKIAERDVSLAEAEELSSSGQLQEVFGAGTAAVVAPVSAIHSESLKRPVTPKHAQGPLSNRFWSELTDIQYGRREHPWSLEL